jgi:hypothetical protein
MLNITSATNAAESGKSIGDMHGRSQAEHWNRRASWTDLVREYHRNAQVASDFSRDRGRIGPIRPTDVACIGTSSLVRISDIIRKCLSDGGTVPVGCHAGLAGAETSRRISRDWQPGIHYWPAPHGRSGASITTATMQKCCRRLWCWLFQRPPGLEEDGWQDLRCRWLTPGRDHGTPRQFSPATK